MLRISPLILLAISLQGCNSSDQKAPYISAQSTFSCQELNVSQALQQQSRVRQVLGSAYGQLDREYKEGTAIQEFYRSLVRKDPDYAILFQQEIIASCDGVPERGVNQAATDALNSLYQKTATQPRLATCASYINGKISSKSVYEELSSQTGITFDRDPVTIVLSSTEHGPGFLHEEVSQHCKNNPHDRLLSAYYKISLPIAIALATEERERKNAETMRKYEEAAEAARKQRMENYSRSLYASEKATCEHFREQFHLSRYDNEDKAIFEQALKATLLDIPQPGKDYQQAAFSEALANNFQDLAESVSRNCYSDETIESALLKTGIITSAKSPY